MNLDNLIVPIHADAMDLPFAQDYFDVAISVDAYYYFGRTEDFMDAKFAPFIKPGGKIALAFPGFKQDIHKKLPKEFFLSWKAEDLETFHSCTWWENLLSKASMIHLDKIGEMSCLEECWNDWLATDNSYAVNDRAAMNAGAGKYMNLISVLATKNT
jgi:SAM-dependent methyltransferase